jgi:hypothetical protein
MPQRPQFCPNVEQWQWVGLTPPIACRIQVSGISIMIITMCRTIVTHTAYIRGWGVRGKGSSSLSVRILQFTLLLSCIVYVRYSILYVLLYKYILHKYKHHSCCHERQSEFSRKKRRPPKDGPDKACTHAEPGGGRNSLCTTRPYSPIQSEFPLTSAPIITTRSPRTEMTGCASSGKTKPGHAVV